MFRYILGWFNPEDGKTGYYSKTYKNKDEARKGRDKMNRKYKDRAHGIVPKGWRDGR